MKLETWLAVASIGLSVMFVALILSLFNFLIGPDGEGPQRVVDPGGLLIQQVSISAAPSIILAVITFVMSRGYGNKLAALLILASGAIMIAGMAAASGMLPQIKDQYRVGGISVVPYLFMAAGAGVLGIGGLLLSISSRRKSAGHLDDLR